MKKKKNAHNAHKRINWVFAGVVFVALVLLVNLFYLQIYHGEEFRAKADNQYVVATYNAFERGSIFFQNSLGEKVVAAGQRTGYKISITPKKLTSEEISRIQAVFDSKEIEHSTINPNRTYQEISKNIEKEDAIALKEELGDLIQLHSEKWRVYPLKTAAAQTIGLLGYQGDEYAGRYGLERQYENVLVRKDRDLYTNFFARIFHDAKGLVDPEVDFEGEIVTHLDPEIQLILDREISTIQETWNSASTGAIIVRPKTGEVVAMGAYPSFDPNDTHGNTLSDFQNPLVENVYELGSVMKPLVVAMGLDQDVISASSSYYDSGSVEVGPHTINNFDKKGRGYVTIQDVLNQSLNTGMVFVAQKLEKTDFRDYFEKYGFGKSPGIDLPNDVSGLVRNLESNRDIEFANMSFGQGVAISPVAFVKALTSFANAGKTVTPHVVDYIDYRNGLTKKIETENGVQVIAPETAEEISRMLVEVYDSYGDGKHIIPGYSIAAKTGTAQIAHPTEGGYYDDRNLHSFFGYFPAYDPEFLVLLYTEHPKQVRYASETLLPPFRDIAMYLINEYNITPDR
jgi:cell division protein FtsI/penicillin-binding protein 2